MNVFALLSQHQTFNVFSLFNFNASVTGIMFSKSGVIMYDVLAGDSFSNITELQYQFFKKSAEP